MHILLVNLTRFGDLLQTQPLIHDLKDQGHHITLLCLDNFMGAAELLQGVDRIEPLHGAALLAALDRDWRAAAAGVDRLAAKIARPAPDRVINLTSTPAGRLLALRLAGNGTPEGFALDRHGFGCNSSLWASFLEASSRIRGCSPFNVADLFRKAGGRGVTPGRAALAPVDPAVRREMRERLRRAASGCAGFAALQLGASEDRRRWPVEFFAALGKELRERDGLMPVLLGTASEQPLAAAYAAAGGPGIDLTGGTTPAQLAAVLRACRVLVTNDTGTMHLAAGLGVPCAAVFLATAQPWDTGPYLEGCFCLEPDLDCHPCTFGSVCPHNERCRRTVRPETAAALIRALPVRGRAAAPVDAAAAAGSRIWRTRLDADGFMDLECLSGHDTDPRTLWLRVQRHFYRRFLDADGAIREGNFLPLPALPARFPEERRRRIVRTLEASAHRLALLREQGVLFLRRPQAEAGRCFLAGVHRLSGLWDASEDFNALGRLWFTAAQERGNDLPRVLELVCGLEALIRGLQAVPELKEPDGDAA